MAVHVFLETGLQCPEQFFTRFGCQFPLVHRLVNELPSSAEEESVNQAIFLLVPTGFSSSRSMYSKRGVPMIPDSFIRFRAVSDLINSLNWSLLLSSK